GRQAGGGDRITLSGKAIERRPDLGEAKTVRAVLGALAEGVGVEGLAIDLAPADIQVDGHRVGEGRIEQPDDIVDRRHEPRRSRRDAGVKGYVDLQAGAPRLRARAAPGDASDRGRAGRTGRRRPKHPPGHYRYRSGTIAPLYRVSKRQIADR